MCIQNFRCYMGEHKFNLDNQTILLYGENGYGKSSFFDAIEWCLTGNITRFTKSEEKNIDKRIILNRYAQEGEKCSVSLQIDDIILKRSFIIRENPREVVTVKDCFHNVTIQGKDNVDKYIRERVGKKSTNGKILTSLIKKSHILSQDQITDFVLRDKPKDRFNALADIMGYKQLLNLLENLKRVQDKLKNLAKKHQLNIDTYGNIIKNKEEEKEEFDLYEVMNLLRKLNIDVNDSERMLSLNNKKDQLINHKVKLEDKLVILQKTKKFEYFSFLDIENLMNNLKKEIDKEIFNENRIINLLNKNNEEKKLISKKLLDINNQKKLFKEKQAIESEINKLNLLFEDVENSGDYIKHLDMFLKEEEEEQQKLLYVTSHYSNYKQYQREKAEFPNKLNEVVKNIKHVKKRIERGRRHLAKFQNLLDNQSEGTSFNSLNNAIQEIYEYVIKNNEVEICPVCSTFKGAQLSSIIFQNVQRNLSEISKSSQKISKVNKIIKELKEKIERLTKELELQEANKKNLNLYLSITEENIAKIEKHQLYSKDLFVLEEESIQERVAKTTKNINHINHKKIKYLELNSLLNKLKEFSNMKLKSDENIQNSLLEREKQLVTREKLLELFENKGKDNKERSEREYKEKQEIFMMLSRIINKDSYNIPIKLIKEQIKKEFENVNENIKNINLALEYDTKLRKNLHVENDIKELNMKLNQESNKLKDYVKKIDDIKKFRESIYLQIGDKASDLLNKQNSSIQKYFRYLNPLPRNNQILFNSPNPEELEIVLFSEDEGRLKNNLPSVQYSMSSGQLYVLAISVFLAMNEAQDVSEFNFVGIDDPIQNMDDVNQFSICDVLSSIEKQLIFSTHDFNFLKLYLKKNEYRKDAIKVFILKSNDNSVTEVQELDFKEDRKSFL